VNRDVQSGSHSLLIVDGIECIFRQMQGQSKAEDIVVCRKTLHSTSKVMRLNGESFSISGSFCAIAALSARCQE
jgi:hypothetical protein